MRQATILLDYSDVATRARLQQVANELPMEWDSRTSFWVAWPRGEMVGVVAGNTAAEALEGLP